MGWKSQSRNAAIKIDATRRDCYGFGMHTDDADGMLPEFAYGHMVQEAAVARVRALAGARRQRVAALRSRADAERYVEAARRAIGRAFGPWPTRTPLNVQTTGILERRAYRIENLLFESRPGLFVTANLYLPAPRSAAGGRCPAVLGLCGHSENGKAYPQYQGLAQGLARQGFVVLILDPIGQGERWQVDRGGPGSPFDNCCDEHNMWGKQLGLVGECFGAWRVWDARRALDVLLDRPEVDPRRVGATGVSGGGTLTTFLHALEPRLTMSAPACYVTTWRHNLENELPVDSEQAPPGLLGAGFDIADFIIAGAPRPVLLLSQAQDYFDPRGFDEAFEDIRRVYGLLRAGAQVARAVGPGRHGYGDEIRNHMYRFFGRHAGLRLPARPLRLTLERDEDLAAAPQGNVRNIQGNRLLPEWAGERARAAAAARRPPVALSGLAREARALLTLAARRPLPAYRVLRTSGDNACRHFYSTIWSFAIETDPGIQAILQVWDPQNPMTASQPHYVFPRERELTLYLPHLSSRADVLGHAVPVRPPLLYSLDVRGLGRGMALVGKNDPFLYGYGSDYMYAALGLMLGVSYLGRRVHDVLAVLDLMAAGGTQRVHLVGRGLGGVLAAFAGALHPVVDRVTLKNVPLSYHEMTQTDRVGWPLSVLPHGVLRRFDLPDLYRALGREKRLRLVDPWNAQLHPWPPAALAAHRRALGLPARLFAPR